MSPPKSPSPPDAETEQLVDCPHCGARHPQRLQRCPTTSRKMPAPTVTDVPATIIEGPCDDPRPRTTGDPFAASESTVGDGSATLRFEWGQDVQLRDGDQLELGRDPAWCSLASRMPDNISSRHCRIEVSGDSVTVTDLRSTNGTFVDGRRIEPLVAVPMRRDCRLASDPPVLITLESNV